MQTNESNPREPAYRPVDTATAAATATSVVPSEIARFDRLAAAWWDPNGPMRPLHRMNGLRTSWASMPRRK